MESPVLPLRVEYRCTSEANLVLYEVLAGGRIERRWWKSFPWQRPATLLFFELLAIIWSAITGNHLLACILAAGAIWHFRQVVSDYRRMWHDFDRRLAWRCDKDVLLEVSERGFIEHDTGVESFCPWSAMKGYSLVREVLSVELSNGLWAVIPGSTLSPTTITLSHLEDILVQHGVARRS